MSYFFLKKKIIQTSSPVHSWVEYQQEVLVQEGCKMLNVITSENSVYYVNIKNIIDKEM